MLEVSVVRRSIPVVIGMCVVIVGASVAPQPVEARGFFRHLTEKMAVRGAEAGAVGYGVAELGATATLAEATESIEVSAGGMSQAIADIRAFLSRHRLAGNSEMAHAMKKAVEDHPDRLHVMQNLASQSGVKVDLTKVKKKLEPPGRCSWKRYGELKDAKEEACRRDGVSVIRSCRTQVKNESREDKIDRFNENMKDSLTCQIARMDLMLECFEKGDEGHQTAIDDIQNNLNTCIDEINKAKGDIRSDVKGLMNAAKKRGLTKWKIK